MWRPARLKVGRFFSLSFWSSTGDESENEYEEEK
jgi:hypothetical protein